MKNVGKAGVGGAVGLELLSLFSPINADAQARFSGSVALEGYLPSTEKIGEGGVPLGVDLRGDYGNRAVGFWGSFGWYGKIKRKVTEYRYRGPGDGKEEGSRLLRLGGGLRFGPPLKHLSVGGFIGEQDNFFEVRDRKWTSYEIDTTHDFDSFYGFCGGFTFGGKVKEGSRHALFFRGEFDYLLHKLYDKPVWGVKFGVGANFQAP